MLKSDSDTYPSRKSWCALLKQLLGNLGYYEVWLFQEVGHVKLFLFNVKARLNDNFIQGWHSRIENSSRAAFYQHVAHFKFQPYLNVCGITKFRYYLTRIRVSSHRHYIESGRWAKPNPVPVEHRKCTICNTLEDEYHFLLECSIYTNLRCQYIPRYLRFKPNMHTHIKCLYSLVN